MITDQQYHEYIKILEEHETSDSAGLPVTSFLTDKLLKDSDITIFLKKNRFKYKNNVMPGTYTDVTSDEHPKICGGVTEYITKMKLAKLYNYTLDDLKFFNDYKSYDYKNLTLQELAFYLYEDDIKYRSRFGYTPEIYEHKGKIIAKADYLSEIALELILGEFPEITSIDFHPEGHVRSNGVLIMKGDSDLVINNCLIDFKAKKDYKLAIKDGAQLFAYSINRLVEQKVNYDKAYILNPRFRLLEEII